MKRSKEEILARYHEKCGAFEVSHDIGEDDIYRTYINTERFLAETIYTGQKDFVDFPEGFRDLYRLTFADQRVMNKFSDGAAKERQEFEELIEEHSLRAAHDNPFSAFIVTDKESDQVVGYEVIGNGPGSNIAEVVYLFRHDYQRHKGSKKNVGYENVGALIWGHGKDLVHNRVFVNQDYDIESVQFTGGAAFTGVCATVRSDDWGSEKILGHLGFSRTGVDESSFGVSRCEYELDYSQFLPELTTEQAAAESELLGL
jgi:hypothetical protein